MATDQSEYPYLDQETYDNLKEIGATPEQKTAANLSAKKSIDERLAKYKHLESETGINYDALDAYGGIKLRVVVVGETGSGKSATANSLLGERRFKESSSAVSMTTEATEHTCTLGEGSKKIELSVLDSPHSWNAQIKRNKKVKVDCYIFVINLASPRFTKASRRQLKRLKGANKKTIIDSGRCFVVLSHADSALQQKSLDDYLAEIKGDDLHSFLVQDMKSCMLAVNNAASVKYERKKNQQGIMNELITCMEKKSKKKKRHGLCTSTRIEDVSAGGGKGNEKKKRETRTTKNEYV